MTNPKALTLAFAIAIVLFASPARAQAEDPIVGNWQLWDFLPLITYKANGTCDQHWADAPQCAWRKRGEGRYLLIIGGTKTMPMHMEGDELVFEIAPSPDAPPARYHRVPN